MKHALVVGLLALVGCGGAPATEANTTTARATTGGERATLRDLTNATLPNVCMGGDARVEVTNGAATYDSEVGDEVVGELEVEAIGALDLDGDGTVEHLAMIRCMPGGSGTFDSIVAFHETSDGPVVAATIEGGDRADGGLDVPRIDGTSVIVGRYSGSEEGVCCPTHVTDETWQLMNGAFARTSVGQTRPFSPE